MSTYLSRLADLKLDTALRAAGAVLIEGVRGCGKTATARNVAASEVLLDVDDDALALAAVEPSVLLTGETPRLLDEWQLAPALWNRVRRAVDDRQLPGQFILTGSASPSDDITRHSGAGRVLRMRMRTLSLFEGGESGGEVSVASLLAGESVSASSASVVRSVSELAELICRGGWPAMRGLTAGEAAPLLRSYLDDIARVDLPALSGEPSRDPVRVRRLLTAIGRHVGTEVANSTLAADAGGAEGPLRPETVAEYLSALQRIFVIEQQPSWAPHLRSRDTVRKRAKLHFVDPALAAAARGASPGRLLGDLNALGQLFESLVVRDLRSYAQAAGARVSHYRDASNLEVDAIVEAADGRWIAVEVKLGQQRVDEAARSLLSFARKVDSPRTPDPEALVVVTTGGFAYRREDGVLVVPITMLGP